MSHLMKGPKGTPYGDIHPYRPVFAPPFAEIPVRISYRNLGVYAQILQQEAGEGSPIQGIGRYRERFHRNREAFRHIREGGR